MWEQSSALWGSPGPGEERTVDLQTHNSTVWIHRLRLKRRARAQLTSNRHEGATILAPSSLLPTPSFLPSTPYSLFPPPYSLWAQQAATHAVQISAGQSGNAGSQYGRKWNVIHGDRRHIFSRIPCCQTGAHVTRAVVAVVYYLCLSQFRQKVTGRHSRGHVSQHRL